MSIPTQQLVCHICSGKPTFSDVSHLLTHLSSKAHLAAEFKAKNSAGTKPEMADAMRQFDAWSKRWGLNKLLEQRLAAKELKKANEPSERTWKPREEKNVGGKPATKTNDERRARPGNHGGRTNLPAARAESSDSSEDELNYKKLKGVKFPGMGMFDAADDVQKKKRNQRKDASVVKKMLEDSLKVDPIQRIYCNDFQTMVQAKSCYATPTPHNSEDEEDVKKKQPKAGRSSKGSKPATATATQQPTGTQSRGPNPGPVMRPPTTQHRPNHWDREEREKREAEARRERRHTMGHNFPLPPRAPQFQLPQDDPFTAPPERMPSNVNSFANSLRPRPPPPPPNRHALQRMNPNTNPYMPPEALKPPSQSARYFPGRARPGMSFPSRHDGGFLNQLPNNTGTMLDAYADQLRLQQSQHERQGQQPGFYQNYGLSAYGREPQQLGYDQRYDYQPPSFSRAPPAPMGNPVMGDTNAGNMPAPPAPMGNPAMGVAPMAPMAPMDPFTQAQIGHGNAPVHPQYDPGRQFQDDDDDFAQYNCDLPYGGARGGGGGI